MERRVSVKVQRYASNGLPPRIEQYEVPQKEGMTILDALMFIKENLDGSLAFRASCRMGICGSCAMFVNGYPYLACHTQIHEIGKQELIIKPLPNFPVVKDLVVDLSSLFDRHRAVLPYLIRSEEPDETRPIVQRPDELEAFLKFSYCIKCGICISGCPTCASDPTFLGPQALAQAWRYCADNRDEGFAKRKEPLDRPHSVWNCHLAGACSEACPKGVDPALGIQRLKRALIASYFGLFRKHKAILGSPVSWEAAPPEGAPRPPERTVAPEGTSLSGD